MKNIKICILNDYDTIPVSIILPEDIYNNLSAKTFEETQNKIKYLSPIIENLSHQAFIERNKVAWNTVQNLLFYLNYNDITRKNRVQDFTPVIELILRKIILDQEIKTIPTAILDCKDNFSPESAVQEMMDKANSHRINYHPLLAHMSENGLSKKAVLHFISNYYVNNRLFHLFIVTLSLFTPLEHRTELANNFYDELGSGDNSMAHPKLFLKNFDTLGRPNEILPFAESLHLANAKTYAAYLSGDHYYGMGGFGFLELTMPEQMKKILKGFTKSGLPKKDLEFWEIHITVDLEHGKTWFREMLDLVKTPEQAIKCLQSGIRLLEARATMFDGIWHIIQSEKI